MGHGGLREPEEAHPDEELDGEDVVQKPARFSFQRPPETPEEPRMHLCRHCRQRTPFLRLRPFCSRCWAVLPTDLQDDITSALKAKPSKVVQAAARRLMTRADSLLREATAYGYPHPR